MLQVLLFQQITISLTITVSKMQIISENVLKIFGDHAVSLVDNEDDDEENSDVEK